jgi:hypothetical protein
MTASFGRTEPRYEKVPLGHHFPRHVFARAWAVQDAAEVELRLRWDRNPADRAAQLLTRQVGRARAPDDITDAELRGESAFGHRPH